MDVFPDRESARDFDLDLQEHDYNFGITEEGLFWTALIAPESAIFHPRGAEMCLRDQFIPDMESFLNAVARGPMHPSTIAIECDIASMQGRPDVVRDPDNRFVFWPRNAESAVRWRATGTRDGQQVSIESRMTDDPQETLFGAVGFERNGRFFR